MSASTLQILLIIIFIYFLNTRFYKIVFIYANSVKLPRLTTPSPFIKISLTRPLGFILTLKRREKFRKYLCKITIFDHFKDQNPNIKSAAFIQTLIWKNRIYQYYISILPNPCCSSLKYSMCIPWSDCDSSVVQLVDIRVCSCILHTHYFFSIYWLSMEQPQMSKSSVFGLWNRLVYPSLESSVAFESPFRHVKNKGAFVPRPVSCHQRSVHQRHEHERSDFC